jgi:uncharacterized membrane protein YdbT with pleckstrin-like domain
VAFPRKLLNEGEDVVLDLRPHWWYMAEPTAALVGSLVLLWLALADTGDKGVGPPLEKAAGVLVLACIVWFVIRYGRWATTNFVVTTDRVVFRRGVLSKSGIEIPLDKINTVFFHQGIFERMLRAGDLRIESAGERGTESFADIRRPSIVQNVIYKEMEANENRKFDRIGARDAAPPAAAAAPVPPTQPAPSGGAIPEQLDKLDDLRKRGVISEEEFAQKKAELLRRM